ncbi:MAG: 2TM domain-containing protein [Spirochaetota bacterium]|nr:MAG: 2TM domain-containing protein [Spirochaetota bacterium]
MGKQDEKLASAKKAAKEKVDFIRHLIIYVAVIVFLIIINNVTYSGYQWWKWPAIGWGIGVFFHFIGAWGFKGGKLKRLEEKLTEKELERMKDKE